MDAPLKTDSPEFLGKVEDAWYDRTKGELVLVPDDGDLIPWDAELADVVARLARYASENIALTASAQYDARGEEIPEGIVTAEEMARRVAAALNIVLYGGAS